MGMILIQKDSVVTILFTVAMVNVIPITDIGPDHIGMLKRDTFLDNFMEIHSLPFLVINYVD